MLNLLKMYTYNYYYCETIFMSQNVNVLNHIIIAQGIPLNFNIQCLLSIHIFEIENSLKKQLKLDFWLNNCIFVTKCLLYKTFDCYYLIFWWPKNNIILITWILPSLSTSKAKLPLLIKYFPFVLSMFFPFLKAR